MTIDTVVEGEIVETPAFTKTQAVQHNQKVQGAISAVNATGKAYDDAGAALTVLLAEARNGQIHVGLGLPSWTAYLEQYVRIEPRSIEDRRAMTAQMVEAGMSNRAIAPIMGVSEPTTRRDVAQVRHDDTAAEPAEGEPAEPEPEPEPTPITGRDGKTYQRKPPKPKPPAAKKPTIAAEFTKLLAALTGSIDGLVKLSGDAKFAKSQTIVKQRGSLEAAHNMLQEVIDKLV
jgi:transposase-like protein